MFFFVVGVGGRGFLDCSPSLGSLWFFLGGGGSVLFFRSGFLGVLSCNVL